jgi:hypothetical protein
LLVKLSGFLTKKSPLTFAICENPPKKTSPTLNPVRITSSPSLNFGLSLSITVPEKSIPGI